MAQGIDQGDRRVHVFARDPSPRVPTATLARDGSVVADPFSSLASEWAKFAGFWSEGRGDHAPCTLVEPLPRASPVDLRAASKKYGRPSAATCEP
eukprot:3480146-Pyramimonas_sp.AAC.1